MKEFKCNIPILCTVDTIAHKGDKIKLDENDPYVQTCIERKFITAVKASPSKDTDNA